MTTSINDYGSCEQILTGMNFLVTAGPTRGWVDRIRFLTTPSTGKMGLAAAECARDLGASVTLVIGPNNLPAPDSINVYEVETPNEMKGMVMRVLRLKNIHVLVAAASVLDYVPLEVENRKIPSGSTNFTVKFKRTQKIINHARTSQRNLYIVAFKTEWGLEDAELHSSARELIDCGVANVVVANDAARRGAGFGWDTNQVMIVGPGHASESLPLMSKEEVSRHLFIHIASDIRKWRQEYDGDL